MNRFRWHSLGLLLAAAVCVQPLLAQTDGEGRLQWKGFEPDAKPFYQVLETRTTQTMKVGGQESQMTQEQTQSFVIRWTPQPRQGKYLVVKQKIVSLKMAITIGATNSSYDSTKEHQVASSIAPTFDAVIAVERSIVVDPANMAIIEIQEEVQLSEKRDESQLKNVKSLGEKLARLSFEQLSAGVPASVRKASNSTATSEMDLGPAGKLQKTTEYTYGGMEKDKDKITTKSISKTKLDNSFDGFRVRRMTGLNGEGSGNIHFDRARGRIDSSIMNMKTKGVVVVEIAGTETLLDFTLIEETKMTTQDTIPELSKRK
jgi:hypothetical protein